MPLTLIRGLPGSGKSTFAKTLNCLHLEADMFFLRDGKYTFDKAKVPANHRWCQAVTRDALRVGMDVVVSNTFTTKREIEPYLEMAKEFGANVTIYTMRLRYKNTQRAGKHPRRHGRPLGGCRRRNQYRQRDFLRRTRMGCDIHFYVEVKQADGTWKSADEWATEDGFVHVPYGKDYYGNRNYDLFAILANVRNGIGFAGIKTGEGFKYIDEPRGLPANVSPEVANASEALGCDGHSHSYFTVTELLAFDWEQTTRHQGYVTCDQWRVYRETGKPSEWWGDVSGARIRKASPAEMELVRLGYDSDDGHTYSLATWTETYAESVGDFLTDTIPKMQALGENDEVRCVFWFDN